MAIRKKETALSEAMDNLDAARTVRAEWEQELAAADAELAAAQAELPVSPAESPAIALRRTQARERIEVAKNALEAASGAEHQARRAVVAAEAEAMDQQIRAARKKLDEYLTQLDGLLAPVRELTGWSSWAPVVTIEHHIKGTYREIKLATPRERELRAELDRLTAEQDTLRRASSGEEVSTPIAELPAQLRAGGILPDPRAVEAADEARTRQAETDEWAATVAGWQAEVNAAASALGIEPPEVLSTSSGKQWAEQNFRTWQLRAGGAPSEFETLALNCGPEVADELLAEWRER